MRQPSIRQFCVAVTLLAAGYMPAAGNAAEFAWINDAERGTADLTFGEHFAVRYQFAFDTSTPERLHETYKVYHHVFGPGAKTLITKGPGGHYTHHRGLYVGWNKTQFEGGQADFWHCTNGAHQRHVEFLEQKADADQGTMTSVIHWNDAQGNPVIVETRTVSVRTIATDVAPKFGWQIDWSSRLESRRGEITLDGDRQHAGFQFRAANEVADKNSARFIRPAGFPEQEEAYEVSDATDPNKHINLGWFAMSYEVDGKPYCVGYFEDPSMPKPSRFSERPYGRFGAFFATKVKPDVPLTLHYRIVATTESRPAREVWQRRYDAFLNDLKAAAK